jgi:hypothetical protein
MAENTEPDGSAIPSKYILIPETNTFVRIDEENQDYKNYLDWLAEGNEPLPAD